MKLRSIYLCGINTSPTEPPPQPLNFLRGQSLLDLNQSWAWMDRNPGQEMLGRRIGGGGTRGSILQRSEGNGVPQLNPEGMWHCAWPVPGRPSVCMVVG